MLKSNVFKKRRRIIAIAVWTAALAAGAGAVLFLRSDRFQEIVRRALIARVQEATGLTCRLDRLRVNLFSGTFSLDGIALAPRPDSGAALRIDVGRISGVFGLPSPWRRRVRLAVLELDRPRVEIVAGKPGGSGWDPGQLLKTVRTSLDFSIGRLAVRNGMIQLNERTVPVDVSIEDLACEAHYRDDPSSYRIRLSYAKSPLIWVARDLWHSLDLQAVLSMDGVELDSVEIRRGSSVISAAGRLRDWQNPELTLDASGTITAEQDLAMFSKIAAESKAALGIKAGLRAGRSGLLVSGNFVAPSVEYHGSVTKDFKGAFSITETALSLRGLTGRMGNGRIQGIGEIQLRSSSRIPDQFEFSVQNVGLANAALILNVPEIAYDNTADAKGSVRLVHGVEDLEAEVHAVLHPVPEPVPGKSTALEGNLDLSYRRGKFEIQKAELRSPHTRVGIEKASDRVFGLRVSTDLLSEPLGILRGFSDAVESLIGSAPDLMNASGTFELAGEVQGETLDPVSYSGAIGISNGRWRSFSFDTAKADAFWDGRHLALSGLSARRGAENIQGELTLDITGEGPPDVVFTGSLQGIALNALRDLGIETEYAVGGIFSGSGSIRHVGGGWRGNGRFSIRNGSIQGEAFDEAGGAVEVTETLVHIEDAGIRRGAARVNLRGNVELTGNRDIDMSAQLVSLALRDFPVVEENKLDVEGRVTASGRIRGTIADPVVSADFTLEGLRYESWNLGHGQGDLTFEHKAVRGNITVRSELGSFEARGTVSTEQGYPGKVELQFTDWNARRILAGQTPAFLSELSTNLQGNVVIEGRFAEPGKMAARGEIEGGRFKVRDYELRNSGPVRFTIADRKLRFDKVKVVGEGTDLDLSGTIPLDGTQSLDLGLNGPVNLVVMEMPERKIRVSGSSRLNVKASGLLRNPQVVGQAALDNARVSYRDFPFQLSSLRGNIFFSRDLIRFEKVQGNIASGTLEISGALEPRAGEIANSELQFSVRRARLPYPADFRSVVDADLVLRGHPGSQLLSGDINIIRSEYLRNLNIFELLVSKGNAPAAPQVTDPLLMGLGLDVAIHSESGIMVDNALTSLRGSVRLLLRGSPAFPSLTGHIEANEGTIFFRGNRFEIIHGTADLMDRNRINPVLDIRAEADVRAYRLVLNVSGALDRLNVNVTSDPPMSTVDIVSLLATGKSATTAPGLETSRYQSEMTGVTAASLLSENLTGVLGKRVERIFGLQSFRVDPFLAGAENDPTARVTISERISKDLTVTFSRNLSTNEEQIVLIEYDVGRNLSVVATRDEKGQFGLDFRFRRRYK